MKLIAKITVRNLDMINARKEKGLSQAMLAKVVGAGIEFIGALEKLDYSSCSQRHISLAESIADFLGLGIDVIMPEEVRGRVLTLDYEKVSEASPLELIRSTKKRLQLETAIEDRVAEQDDAYESDLELKELIKKNLDSLTYREREILKLRYGVDGSDCFTYEEVGRKFKVSTMRVRQIEAKALKKMQHPTRMKNLIKNNPELSESLLGRCEDCNVQVFPKNNGYHYKDLLCKDCEEKESGKQNMSL